MDTTLTGSDINRYYDLRDARDKARRRLTSIAQEFRSLADDITDFEAGIRVNEKSASRVVRPFKHVIAEERLPVWGLLAQAIREHTKAEDAFLEYEARLDAVTRQRIGFPTPRR